MRPTRWTSLVGIAGGATLVGWLFGRLWIRWAGIAPEVPWIAAFTLLLLAAGYAIAAWRLRPRLRRDDGAKPIDGLVAARIAVLALAGSRAGAVMFGWYLGQSLDVLGDLNAPYARHQLLVEIVAMVGALGLVVAALWLESACRVPPPSSEAGGAVATASGAE
jgi:hypothetical protein